VGAEQLARDGDFRGALKSLGLDEPPDFILKSRDPRQDMQYGESLRLCEKPAPYLRARRFLAATQGSPELLRGVIETILGSFRAALVHLNAAVESGAGSHAFAWRGVARALEERRLKRSDRLGEALADLDRAVALGPARRFAYFWRAELRHDLEDPRGALEDLAAILAQDPTDSWARVERGEILCETGRHEEALAEFDGLVKDFPGEAWARALRGRTLATTGREKESLSDLKEAVKKAPKSAAARAWLSESYRKLGRYRDARKALDAAVKLDVNFALAWVWRGRLSLLLGDPKAALKDLDKAVKLDSRYRLALAWRGEALHKLGRKSEARRDFARVAPLDLSQTWNPVLREGERLSPESRARAYAADLEAAA
jgi:tetratricopeptide (TPR) repeat protein